MFDSYIFAALRRRQRGFSAIEILMVTAVVAIIATFAVPSFTNLAAHQRLRGAADNMRSDLLIARSEAIKRKSHVFVVFNRGAPWCYAITLDPNCGCGRACSSPDSLLKQIQSSEAADGVQLQTVSFAGSYCGSQECVRFEAMHGNAMGSNGTATLLGADGSKYKVVIAPVGRARACRASGDSGGFLPAC